MEAFLKDFPHVKRFNLKEIKSITKNFENSNVIGSGGFGKVYGGVLSHSKGRSMVAFKRLNRKYGQGEPEFLKEIFMLSPCTHENLISLLGFCDEKGEKILVYEHASHGSLDRHLSSTTLMWRQRVKICLGAARGLCYLHDPNKETQQRVIHRDIKSSNILLDENWNAKVSDMGLSRIGPANQQYSFLPTNVVGTPGYIDPQYMETYSLTKESDVYSFGVVLFEVLCGKTCFKYNNPREFEIFVPTWKQSYEEKKLDEIVFHELKPHMDSRSLKTFSDVAYQCVQNSRGGRPEMSQVVKELEIALRFQEDFEVVEQPKEYEESSKTAVPPHVFRSKEPLKMRFSKGILVNESETFIDEVKAYLYTIIKVSRDEDLRKHIEKNTYLDLVNHCQVDSFRIKKKKSFSLFKEALAKELGIPVQYQRFWLWAKRENHTYRPFRPLTPQEEAQSVGQLRKASNKSNYVGLELFLEVEVGHDLRPIAPPDKTIEEILLFFKLYDPSKEELRYVGRLFVKGTGKPIEILAKLNELAGFAPDAEIELFEEIAFDMCKHINKKLTFRGSKLEDGDIVCFQKPLKGEHAETCRYPDVPSFLKYINNQWRSKDSIIRGYKTSK